MDKRPVTIQNRRMRRAGSSRKELAQALRAAYAGGLISHDTLVHRLDRVLDSGLIDTRQVVGDLRLPAAGKRWRQAASDLWHTLVERPGRPAPLYEDAILLALDWSGEVGELLIGRHHSCDIVLENRLVSRRHARLVYRDGSWIIQDLESTNGTLVNGTPVGRCKLCPGDEVVLATARFQID